MARKRDVKLLARLSQAGGHVANYLTVAWSPGGRQVIKPRHLLQACHSGDASRSSVVSPARFLSEASGSRNVAMIKQLRERTGAPMKDVKSALVESDWDAEAAFTELRKRGLAAASKKSARVAAEGLLGVAAAAHGSRAAVVELNCETDFVARNDIYQHLVHKVAAAALEAGDGSAEGAHPLSIPDLEACEVELAHPRLSGRSSVREAVAELIAVTGENVRLRQAYHVSCPGGHVCSYLHTSPQPGLARIVGLVALKGAGGGAGSPEPLRQLGERLAMQAVAARPLYLNQAAVPPEALQKERDILTTQAAASGKTATVVEKMVQGRLRKFYEDVVLLDQKYILDDTKSVKAVVAEASEHAGAAISVVSFLRLAIGEGVERVEKDFAAEVAAQVGRTQ